MSRADKRPIEERVDLRLTPTEAGKLRAVAKARTTNGSKPDALRILIDEAHKGLTRGETSGSPSTKREA